jgi:ABC-2 type transport system ATP-binding protein
MARDLRKRYGAVEALQGVTFEAPAGAITAVLGPNGAGKTTAIEICTGQRRRNQGDVQVLGSDPATAEPGWRARVGVMPQPAGSGAAGIYPAARVRETAMQFAAMYDDPLPVDPLLDRLGLTAAAKRPWRRLSGGEQQRLSLALTIVGRPELVFLDEPSAGLDVEGRIALWELLEDLRKSGVTVVLTTHAMDEAERLADHVVVIAAGQIKAAGPLHAVTGERPLLDVYLDLTRITQTP